MADGGHLEKSKNVVLMDVINSLLKTGNKTPNINVKQLQFIHTVNGDGSKTAKTIKGNVNHTNIDIQATFVWLTLPFCDYCGFRSVAVNSVYKLQFLHLLKLKQSLNFSIRPG